MPAGRRSFARSDLSALQWDQTDLLSLSCGTVYCSSMSHAQRKQKHRCILTPQAGRSEARLGRRVHQRPAGPRVCPLPPNHRHRTACASDVEQQGQPRFDEANTQQAPGAETTASAAARTWQVTQRRHISILLLLFFFLLLVVVIASRERRLLLCRRRPTLRRPGFRQRVEVGRTRCGDPDPKEAWGAV